MAQELTAGENNQDLALHAQSDAGADDMWADIEGDIAARDAASEQTDAEILAMNAAFKAQISGAQLSQ